jgi:chemotaxis protein CheX
MDVAYINPFISATIETYSKMLNDEIKPLKPYIKKEPFPTYGISGTIGLSGGAQGVIALAYSMEGAVKTVSGMLGVNISEKSADLTDAIGEIVNIVAGYAKKDLTEYKLEISLPTVIRGNEHFITTPSRAHCIVVPFSSKYGEFSMEVALITA